MTWQSRCTHKTLDSWVPFPGSTSQKDRRPARSLLVKLPVMLMSAAEEEQKALHAKGHAAGLQGTGGPRW